MPEPASVTLALEIDRSEFTKGISDVQRQLKGLAKTQLSFRETWSSLGLSKQLNIGGGVAVQPPEFGPYLKLGGFCPDGAGKHGRAVGPKACSAAAGTDMQVYVIGGAAVSRNGDAVFVGDEDGGRKAGARGTV